MVRSQSLHAANRSFVDTIRPLIDNKELTAQQVAGLAGVNRQRVHQLLRLYKD